MIQVAEVRTVRLIQRSEFNIHIIAIWKVPIYYIAHLICIGYANDQNPYPAGYLSKT